MARLDAISEVGGKKKTEHGIEEKKQAAAYKSAFWDSMHTGMPRNELKVGSDGSGGYLVPASYDKELVMALEEENVLRKIGTVIKTKNRLRIPTAKRVSTAVWINENSPYIPSDMSFGEVIIDAYKLATSILVSDELLEDGCIDLEEYIKTIFAERIGSAEEEAFIKGDGNNKPLGLIYQAEIGTETASEGIIDMDDVINLKYSLLQPYRKDAIWLMSDDALCTLRKIKNYKGRPIWEDNLKKGEPDRLLGHPVYVCKSLDKVECGKYPIMFGDFSYFRIGERGKRVIKRLVERFADRGQVAFITSERIDAKLVLPEAIKILKVSGTESEETV